ncbi:CfrBI family restriction endonuclease [candidate division KSB1 bacterium]|nr:CfrBI family restriction endonuclease [candidate division KSB1 bacterium]
MVKKETKTGFEWQIEDLNLWWNSRPLIREAFSAEAVRYAVLHLMTGGNYRDITERVVREKLHIYHSWLLQVVHHARRAFGKAWLKELLARLHEAQNKDKILSDMRVWLLGLTHKTVQNLAVSKKDTVEITAFIDNMLSLCSEVSKRQRWSEGAITIDLRNNPAGSVEKLDLAESLWFLQMIGAASLTVRGSNKAVYGKRLERAFLRAGLELLGLKMNESYWLNIERDEEVDREADGEVETKRGRVRIDIGLIGEGNQEVPEDKLNRVGRNGIVIVDRLGRQSAVLDTAQRLGVKLVQIRHNFPMSEIYEHLKPIAKKPLTSPSQTREKLKKQLDLLPDEVFHIS